MTDGRHVGTSAQHIHFDECVCLQAAVSRDQAFHIRTYWCDSGNPVGCSCRACVSRTIHIQTVPQPDYQDASPVVGLYRVWTGTVLVQQRRFLEGIQGQPVGSPLFMTLYFQRQLYCHHYKLICRCGQYYEPSLKTNFQKRMLFLTTFKNVIDKGGRNHQLPLETFSLSASHYYKLPPLTNSRRVACDLYDGSFLFYSLCYILQ